MNTVFLDVVCTDVAPMKVEVDGAQLQMYLDENLWKEKEEGWYFDNELRSAKIKYKNIRERYSISIDMGVKDLISI